MPGVREGPCTAPGARHRATLRQLVDGTRTAEALVAGIPILGLKLDELVLVGARNNVGDDVVYQIRPIRIDHVPSDEGLFIKRPVDREAAGSSTRRVDVAARKLYAQIYTVEGPGLWGDPARVDDITLRCAQLNPLHHHGYLFVRQADVIAVVGASVDSLPRRHSAISDGIRDRVLDEGDVFVSL